VKDARWGFAIPFHFLWALSNGLLEPSSPRKPFLTNGNRNLGAHGDPAMRRSGQHLQFTSAAGPRIRLDQYNLLRVLGHIHGPENGLWFHAEQ
jgi:hypothetical protein